MNTSQDDEEKREGFARPWEEAPIGMTLRFEGLTPQQMTALHETVNLIRTETCANSEGSFDRGNPYPFIEIKKSEMKGKGVDGRYAVLLTVHPILFGCIVGPELTPQELEEWKSRFFGPPPSPSRDWRLIFPSRRALDNIFDTLGILPEKETVKEET